MICAAVSPEQPRATLTASRSTDSNRRSSPKDLGRTIAYYSGREARSCEASLVLRFKRKLVGERGFEPPAPASRRQCPIWLGRAERFRLVLPTADTKIGRGERIRTSGPCLPKTVLYQAE